MLSMQALILLLVTDKNAKARMINKGLSLMNIYCQVFGISVSKSLIEGVVPAKAHVTYHTIC